MTATAPPGLKISRVDFQGVIDSYFDDASRAGSGPPRLVLIVGPVAAGKTFVRTQQYSSGYVLVDAADLFHRQCGDLSLDFPSSTEPFLEAAGRDIAARAVRERRHIVTEAVGRDMDALRHLCEVMKARGYEIELVVVEASPEECEARNASRGPDTVSAFYAEPYQLRWLMLAADLDWFSTFVAARPWRLAKTYVESYPHEYTLDRQGSAADFARAIDCIERWGASEPFWGEERKYLYVDDQKYWHMGNVSSDKPEHRPTLINRTWLDVTRYRENAMTLGYDEPSTEKLAEKWKVMLDRARGGKSA